MAENRLPDLDPAAIRDTRDALHGYARVLGGWLANSRQRRKHWWHASLRPSLKGLSSGVVRSSVDFELELDLLANQLRVRTAQQDLTEGLNGQSAADLAGWLDGALIDAGADPALVPGDTFRGDTVFPGYVDAVAASLQRALATVVAALEQFRAGIREETSPIQVWPHHFDLSMIWLPGPKVPGQDPADEEYADKQMNFGFGFGDGMIAESYFYVTAYPLPDALPSLALPSGTVWMSDGFSGAVLLYKDLAAMDDPAAYLQHLWSTLLTAGRAHLAAGAAEGKSR
jgi:ethanolamine utilization microcompartment shell protein EutS